MVEHLEDEATNAWLGFFRRTVPDLLAGRPDLIGVSVTYPQQLIAALTLARCLRTAAPDTPLVLGGQVPTQEIDVFERQRGLFELFDCLVVSDGETALAGLAERPIRGDGRGAWEDIPNLRYLDGDELVRTRPHQEDLDELPTPDYRGLPLDRYLAPEPVLAVQPTRGCYWGRCAFCGLSKEIRFRVRKPEKVAEDFQTLAERHGASRFSMCGDVTTPRLLLRTAREMLRLGLDVRWSVETRFDDAFSAEATALLHEAGCRLVMLGFESGNQRVQDLMNKGYQVDAFPPVVERFAGAGIHVALECFIGFPGETEEEGRDTVDFLLAQSERVSFVTVGRFGLVRRAAIWEDPERYGVTIREEPSDLLPRYSFERAVGLPDEARLVELQREAYARLLEGYPWAATAFGQATGGAHPLLYAAFHSPAFFHRPPPTPPDPGPLTARAALASVATLGERLLLSPPLPRDVLGLGPGPDAPLPGPLTYVLDEADSRMLCPPPEAGALLRALDGRRTLREALAEVVGAERADAALGLAVPLLERGLIELR